MEFRKPLPACLFLTLLPTPVLACSCAPQSMGFCQAPPDMNNANHAVFRSVATSFGSTRSSFSSSRS